MGDPLGGISRFLRRTRGVDHMTVSRITRRGSNQNSTMQPRRTQLRSGALRRTGWGPIVLAAVIFAAVMFAAAQPTRAAVVYAWGNNGDGQLGNGTSNAFGVNPT